VIESSRRREGPSPVSKRTRIKAGTTPEKNHSKQTGKDGERGRRKQKGLRGAGKSAETGPCGQPGRGFSLCRRLVITREESEAGGIG